jgi:hypothetical protein
VNPVPNPTINNVRNRAASSRNECATKQKPWLVNADVRAVETLDSH